MVIFKRPSVIDLTFLSFFLILITAQPFFLHHEIIMMETGIHLPGLNALFHGAVPYKDFFYLRGPFELYVPAFLMLLFGKSTAILPVFYYVGTVATLLVGVVLAQQLYQTRFILYLMVPVFIGRTFPRISYYYWGGMRYALGFLALLCAVFFFKKNKPFWMFLAGIVSCLALLTTIESGVCTIIAISAALIFSFVYRVQERGLLLKSAFHYGFGIITVLIPYVIYLSLTNSLIPYIETQYVVLTGMTKTFIDAAGNHPESFLQFLAALIPSSRFFKFMTPVFFYIIFISYMVYHIRTRRLSSYAPALVGLAVYGLILYIAAFRKIEGHHFEMALQPEKILLFFLVERFYFFLKEQKDTAKRIWKVYAFRFFIFVIVGSSLGYSIQRYNHRFTVFKLVRSKVFGQKTKSLTFLDGQETRKMDMERLKGMTIPRWQAVEIEKVVGFLKKNTKPKEASFYYPEVGNFAFWADRPFIGRFPVATTSWLKDSWTRELMEELKHKKPKFVIMTKLGHRTFPEEWYFRNEKNREHFHEFTEYILANYKREESLSSVEIYRLK